MRPHLAGDRNECPTCKELFNSSTAFDMHRTGEYERRDPKGKLLSPSTRRCLSIEEMSEKGMLKNARGFWITRARDPKDFSQDDEEEE